MNTNLQPTTIRVDPSPTRALQTGPDGVERVSVTPCLKPDDLDEADSTHALGSGFIADERWRWVPDAEDLFTQLVGEPWRAPGSRMIGSFKSGDLHTCGAVDNVGVFLFVNPTDVVFGTTPCPLWIWPSWSTTRTRTRRTHSWTRTPRTLGITSRSRRPSRLLTSAGEVRTCSG